MSQTKNRMGLSKAPACIVLVLAFLLVPLLQADTYVRVQKKAEACASPQVLTVNSSGVVTVFGTNNATQLGRILYRSIQNTGVVPFLYTINSTNVSTSNYHGVVAGGQVIRDGLGSIVDFSKIPYPVSMTTESGSTTVAVVELTQ
jgi:acetyl-CoA carboxylase carboxyltransferase component